MIKIKYKRKLNRSLINGYVQIGTRLFKDDKLLLEREYSNTTAPTCDDSGDNEDFDNLVYLTKGYIFTVDRDYSIDDDDNYRLYLRNKENKLFHVTNIDGERWKFIE